MNFNFADPAMIIAACAIVLLIVIAIVFIALKRSSRRRTEELRSRFGPEYDLALREFGSRRKAEATLLDRVNRIDQLKIRDLTLAENTRYLTEWDSIQSRFIDHPRGAVTEADEMINSLLATCGYPAGPFAQRASDLSVRHSRLMEPYRRTNAITVRAGKNEATTEELRSAMILYRALFEEFMQATTVETPIDVSRPEAA
jgi:hypothetical protein